jgi:NADH-quinone oxidoreductase subunit K
VKPTLEHYLVLGALLFALGLFTVITRRSVVGILLGIALISNAGALNFVAFDHFVAEERGPSGQVFALLIVVLAASEAVVALALLFRLPQSPPTAGVGELTEHPH